MELPVSRERQEQFAKYVSRYFFEGDAEELKAMLRSPFDLYETSDEEYRVLDEVVDAVQRYRRPLGPEDAQMPALTKVAPIVARYAGDPELMSHLETAVRATNNSDLAVAYAKGLARALEAIVTGGLEKAGPEDAPEMEILSSLLEDSFTELPADRKKELQKALGMRSQDPKAVTLKFGPACDCAMGVPVALHNLITSESFAEATRINIWSCGDSAGRAMILGSLSGAFYGVGGSRGIPEDWIEKTAVAEEARSLLREILP
jgi:ADP-ribosylglycohydrolase